MPANSPIPAKSIRSLGAAKRWLMVGNRVWPPDR